MSNKESIELYGELHRLVRQLHRVSHWGWQEHGHYREVSRLLRIIAENDGMMQRDLAEEMDVRPSSMTEMLARMEAHGLVERKQDEKDARVVRVYLTAEGRKMAGESAEATQELASSMFGSLTEEEVVQMLALTKKLCAGLDGMDAPEFRHEWHGRHHQGHGCDGEGGFGRHGCGERRCHGRGI